MASFSLSGLLQMFLVELFIPKVAASKDRLSSLQYLLVEQFGGLTAYSRAPAKGIDMEGGKPVEEEIIILEVMTDSLDRAWWSSLRVQLERDLQQLEILIRATDVQRLLVVVLFGSSCACLFLLF